MKRRNFIKTGVISLTGISISPFMLSARDCTLTSADIEGPYWSENHPNRTILANPDEPGTRIFISGVVLYNDCETPIENAIIDVWHANDNGCYTVFQECQSGNTDQDPYNLRGYMRTDENGNYAFESILPGYYSGRPRHFHFKITSPSGFEHITQCYFQNDPSIDENWEENHPGLIIPLEETESGFIGNFDIILDEILLNTDYNNSKSLSRNFKLQLPYPNPFNNSINIQFEILNPGNVNINIYDVNGKWITTLVNKNISSGMHLVKWNGLDSRGMEVASGLYLVTMKFGENVKTKTLNLVK